MILKDKREGRRENKQSEKPSFKMTSLSLDLEILHVCGDFQKKNINLKSVRIRIEKKNPRKRFCPKSVEFFRTLFVQMKIADKLFLVQT